MALDAQIELRRGDARAPIAAADFYLDYMKNRLEPASSCRPSWCRWLPARRQVRAYKISKRFDCDISALCAGLCHRARRRHGQRRAAGLSAAWRRWSSARRRPRRRWSASPGRGDACGGAAALAEDFKPLTDMRASAAYRAQVAATCCSASGSRRARKTRCRPAPPACSPP
jgi:xanthine dehydrogenase small subunit